MCRAGDGLAAAGLGLRWCSGKESLLNGNGQINKSRHLKNETRGLKEGFLLVFFFSFFRLFFFSFPPVLSQLKQTNIKLQSVAVLRCGELSACCGCLRGGR